MLFTYTAIDQAGHQIKGELDAANQDVALASLQSRGFVITSIRASEDKPFWELDLSIFNRVSGKEIVMMSRQISTLFEAQVSALRIFRLMSDEAENPEMRRRLSEIADDLQGGASISRALAKHPTLFSDFYVNMVRSGEETGKLSETFQYLAAYLDRTYEVNSKVRGALYYPGFVIFTFIAVMWIMLAVVIPKLGDIMRDAGIEPPIYTQIVLFLSKLVTDFGYIIIIAVAATLYALWRYYKTPQGRFAIDGLKLRIPIMGDLFRKLYLSRIADNISTMLGSGISMIRTIEITATVVGNVVYEQALNEVMVDVKNGATLSIALARHPEIPGIMSQMIKVGEETGEVGSILKTIAHFYQREVENAVDTLISLIEPLMIVFLGLGVGVLLASVLIPIYNITLSI